MVNHKIKAYLIYLLLIVAGIFSAKAVYNFLPKPQPVIVDKTTPPVLLPVKPAIKEAEKTVVEQTSKNEIAANSAVAVQKSESVLPELTVSGILFSPDTDESFALINNIVVRKGESIEGAVVTNISEDWVELKFGDRSFKVELKKSL